MLRLQNEVSKTVNASATLIEKFKTCSGMSEGRIRAAHIFVKSHILGGAPLIAVGVCHRKVHIQYTVFPCRFIPQTAGALIRWSPALFLPSLRPFTTT